MTLMVDRRRDLRPQRRQLAPARHRPPPPCWRPAASGSPSTIERARRSARSRSCRSRRCRRSCATSSSLTGEPLRQATTIWRSRPPCPSGRRPAAPRPASARSACRPGSRNWRATPRCGCRRATARAPRRLPDRPGRGWRISARRRSLTCATPGICDSVWPMVMSPYSLTADSGSVAEPSDDEQHREVGRVHLAETRRDRHLDRQPALRDGQRGLHVERGGIDVAVEIELDGDDAGALRGTRRHRGDAGDGRELALDDAGDRGRHGIGARARQGRGDGNGREIDPRQRRDRQQAEAENAERDDRRRDQRRHDRPADAEFGERHRLRPGLPGPRLDPRSVRQQQLPVDHDALVAGRALPRSPTCPARCGRP